MAETKYGKYVVTKPVIMPQDAAIAHHPDFDPHGGKPPRPGSGVYLSGDIVPGCPSYCGIQRTSDVPPKQPFIVAHKHDDADEYIFFVAAGPDAELGTTVIIELGEEGEKHSFSETTVVYVPKGLVHCPIWYSPFREGKEFYLIALLMQPNYPVE
jgi:hypothetical protein